MEAQSNVCAYQVEMERRHRAHRMEAARTRDRENGKFVQLTDSARQRERKGTPQGVRQSRANSNSTDESKRKC